MDLGDSSPNLDGESATARPKPVSAVMGSGELTSASGALAAPTARLSIADSHTECICTTFVPFVWQVSAHPAVGILRQGAHLCQRSSLEDR